MLRNKRALITAMGLLGGVGGSLVGELAGLYEFRGPVLSVIQMALWGMLFAGSILLSLSWGLELYAGKRRIAAADARRSILSGGIAGAIGASSAQLLFGVHHFNGVAAVLFHAVCWGLCGLILGWRVAKSIPNLGSKRGTMAGFVGGFVGGLGFLAAATFLYDIVGRLVGLGIMGAALGFSIVTVEEFFREAYLEITWRPKEVSRVSLGPVPITVGGGADNVFVATLKERAATIKLDGDNVHVADHSTGTSAEYPDGASFAIGGVTMTVHIRKITVKTQK